MNNYDEESYKRYKQYRLNKYRYEQEQKLPLYIIILLGILSTVWHYILFALVLFVIIFFAIAIYRALRKKEMTVEQPIILTSEEAENGTELEVYIKNIDVPLTLNVKIPPKTKNGQKFALRNVRTKNVSGKIVKMDIYFTIEIR